MQYQSIALATESADIHVEPFPLGAGLSMIVRVGMQVNSNDTVKFAPIFRHGQYIAGGHFVFRGQIDVSRPMAGRTWQSKWSCRL